MIYFKPERFETLQPYVYCELEQITRSEFISALYDAINSYAEKVKEVLSLKAKQLLTKIEYSSFMNNYSDVDILKTFKKFKKNILKYIQMVTEIYQQIKQVDSRRREADKLTKFYFEHFIKGNENWIENNSISLHR